MLKPLYIFINQTAINNISSVIDLSDAIVINAEEHISNILAIKGAIEQAGNINIVSFKTINSLEFKRDLIYILGIKQFLDISIKETSHYEEIKQNIEDAVLVEENEINALVAKKEVSQLFDTKISQMLKWWFFKNRVSSQAEINKIFLKQAPLAALSIIAEAEEKIIEFSKDTFRRIGVEYIVDGMPFKVIGKGKYTKEHEGDLQLALNILRDNQHIVKNYDRKTNSKPPYPPLITTQLQRAAVRLFDIDPDKTLNICEKLYNGVVIDGKNIPLITYYLTDGYNISNDAIIDINTLLNAKYGINYTLPVKREFSAMKVKESTSTQECLRPLFFTKDYFPKKLKPFLTKDEYSIYQFLFYKTLATQMKDSIYDNTELTISVEGMQLVAKANKQEFDGWEKLDGYNQKLVDNDDDFEEREVILPAMRVGDRIIPTDVSSYNGIEKTPPRYGKGRFLSTMQEEGIVNAYDAAYVVPDLEKAGIVRIIQHMIHPNEIGMKVYYFFREYSEKLISVSEMRDFQIELEAIKEDTSTKEEIVSYYKKIVDELEVSIAYEDNNTPPDGWMIEKARNIAINNGQILTDDNPMFLNRSMILNYINNAKEMLEELGKCPACKKEQVIENDFSFACKSKGCKFRLYKAGKDGKPGGIDGFFKRFKKHIPEHNLVDLIKVLLKSNGKVFFEDLISKKGEPFGAYVKIEKNKDYASWSLALSFPKSKDSKINEKLKATNILTSASVPIISASLDTDEVPQTPIVSTPIPSNHTNTNEDEKLKLKIKQLEEEKRSLAQAVKMDTLTNSFTRAEFQANIEVFWKTNVPLVLAFVDGDKFKSINDNYGHQAGDAVLKDIVEKLSHISNMGVRSRVYRYGGEEFLILIPNSTTFQALQILEVTRENIEKSEVTFNNQIINYTVSIGISQRTNDDTIKSMLERADKAMYSAKDGGRNRIVCD